MSFNLTIQDLFGANAQLTADQLIISKADLAAVGLDQYPNELAAIFTAILLQAKNTFQGVIVDENGQTLIDSQGGALAYNLDRVCPETSLGLAAKYFNNNRINLEYHVRFYPRQ